MKFFNLIIGTLSILGLTFSTVASEKNKDAHTHDEHGHTDSDEEKHENEASSVADPEKGITEIGKDGFKLSSEAYSTMGIQEITATSNSLTIPTAALVKIKNTKSVFRLRDGWIKRIPVTSMKINSQTLNITSQEIKSGDKVIVAGSGFLRIAEIFTEEGAQGHSH